MIQIRVWSNQDPVFKMWSEHQDLNPSRIELFLHKFFTKVILQFEISILSSFMSKDTGKFEIRLKLGRFLIRFFRGSEPVLDPDPVFLEGRIRIRFFFSKVGS